MKFIVSLTSYGHRLTSTAPEALFSLIRQTIMPDRIILWLAYGETISPILEKLSKMGIEIKFCEDIKSYKKLIPSLLEFPNDIIITADDDLVYPRNWFEQLKTAYLENPTKIHVHRAHQIQVDDNGSLLCYKDWKFCVKEAKNSQSIFPTGGAGALYPPKSLNSLCTVKELFLEMAPTGDDIWFWAMAKLQETEFSIIENGYSTLRVVDPKDNGMYLDNILNGKNDVQLKSIVNYFPVLGNTIQQIASFNSIKPSFTVPDNLNNGKVTIHKIIVLILFHNVRNYIIDCVNSVFGQNYDNYEVYLIDNASNDGTLDLISEEHPLLHKRVNKKQLYSIENTFKVLTEIAIQDEDVVILLNGDDYILGEYAFQIINHKYNEGFLLTHGNEVDNYGCTASCSSYTHEEFSHLREVPYKENHLKTFKYKLFKEFLNQDPNATNLKYDDGSFFKAASDIALMFPLMEIAGFENISSISNIIYYHRFHQNNKDSMDSNARLKIEVENIVRNRKSFARALGLL